MNNIKYIIYIVFGLVGYFITFLDDDEENKKLHIFMRILCVLYACVNLWLLRESVL